MVALATAFVRIRPDPSTRALFKAETEAAVAPGAASAGDKASSELTSHMSAGIKKGTAQITKVARGMTIGLGVAAVAAGVDAVKMAAQFQTGLNKLVTSAGESQKNLKLVGNGIKQIAVQAGTTTTQLTQGMYMIESAGYHGAAGLKVLKSAAEGAKSENADLATVTNALTTVMKDYNVPVARSNAVMNSLIATTSHGKTTLELLAGSMSKVLPTASALGIGMGQVGGAMATMTAEGVTARLAATHLNSTLLAMASPNAVAVKAMNTLGLSAKLTAQYTADVAAGNTKAAGAILAAGHTAQGVSDTLTHHGLVAALQQVYDLALKAGPKGSAAFVSAMHAMTGSTAGVAVALELTGKHLATVQANTKAVGAAFSDNSGKVEGFGLVTQSFAFKLDQLGAIAQTAGISFGQKLIPPLTTAATWLKNNTTEALIMAGAVAGLAVTIYSLSLAIKAVAVITTVVRAFALGVTAIKGWVAASKAAVIVNTAMASSETLSAAATTGFAVAADGTTVAVGGLTVAEGAAAVAGAALAAVNPFVWAAAAVGMLALLARYMITWREGILTTTDAMAKQDDAAGFNIAGYKRLADQTTAAAASSGKLGNAVKADSNVIVAARVGAVAYGQAIGAVSVVHARAASAATNLSVRLGFLENIFGLTATSAEKLAGKAGVTASQLAATGQAGTDAYNKIVLYGGGAGRATVKQLALAQASGAVSAALSVVNSRLLEGQGDLLSWQQAQAGALVALKNSTNGLHGNSQASIDARSAMLQATQQAITFAEHEATLTGGVGKASGVIRQQITWLQQHGDHSRFAAQEVDALRTALAKIKSEHANISVSASGQWKVTGGAGDSGGQKPRPAAKGMYVSRGRTGVDDQLIAAQRGELVVPTSLVSAGAVDHLRGMIPGFASGGVIGAASGSPKSIGSFAVREDAATLKAVEAATASAAAKAISKATSKATIFPGGLGRASLRQIEDWWIGAGGPGGGTAHVAAAITGAESGFNPKIVQQGQPYATTGWGLWQITPGDSEPQAGINQQLLNGPNNAKAAVAKYRGAGGFSPWTTFEDGAYLQFMANGGIVGRPEPGAGGGKGKGSSAKAKYLKELAADVTKRKKELKERASHVAALNNPIRQLELKALQGKLTKAQRATLRRDRRGLAKYRKTEDHKITILGREIQLLRALTGYPKGLKYGGQGWPAPPAPDPSTGDDGSGGDGSGDGTTPSGPTVYSGPPPSFLTGTGFLAGAGPGVNVGAGLGGLASFVPGAGGGLPGPGSGGGLLPMGPGGGRDDMTALLAALLRSHQQLVGIAQRAPSQTAAGFAQGLDGVGGSVRRMAGYSTRGGRGG